MAPKIECTLWRRDPALIGDLLECFQEWDRYGGNQYKEILCELLRHVLEVRVEVRMMGQRGADADGG